MKAMYKIGMIGSKESVRCYKASGVRVFSAESPERARAGLSTLIKDGCAVIFITEELASALSEETAKLKCKPIPAVIPIPGAGGSTGYGIQLQSDACKRAIGMDILK